MKKRVIAVLLVLLMLGALTACNNDGDFYTEDGILQNARITLRVENKSLVAPVTYLSYTLFEETDFSVICAENEDKILLEIRENGEWKKVPTFGKGISETLINREPGNPKLHQTYKESLTLWSPSKIDGKDPANSTLHYLALAAGEYRLRIPYTLQTQDEEAELPEGQPEAVAYFTVTDEDPNNDTHVPKERGEIYTDDGGRKQNSLITLEITNESLIAPVNKLTYNICNASSCAQSRVNMFVSLQMKKDGEWVKAPGSNEEGIYVHRDVWAYGEPIPVLEKELLLGNGRYDALAPGEYRLFVTLDILCDGEVMVQPTAYFTVTAPVQ